ncbi:MAG: glycoside hydrolase family 1 protein [Streptococcaceae bacterium]|nr:glycoside hydrolase family 1 protein [Streptococcaceae bacterium]
MNLQFPEKFWWGAATSGPQTEGRFKKQHDNVFDYDFDHFQERFWGAIGPDTASNFFNDFRDDIELMKAAGLNSVRTSIQWSRLIDDLELGTLNEKAVEFYNAVIDEFLAHGIRPVINLHHFDLPVELLHKYGGWESRYVVDLYADFAGKCFELFSDRVSDWFTFNEPMVVVECGYLLGFHYPDVVDGKRAVQVAYHLQLASSLAIKKFRTINQNPAGQIGIILNLTPAYPTSSHHADVFAAEMADLWQNRLFLDASVKGEFPSVLTEMLSAENALWKANDEDLSVIRQYKIDVLGVNYYHPSRVQEPEFSSDSLAQDFRPDKFYAPYNKRGVRMNADRGWEIHPQTIYEIAKRIQNDYENLPWFISENGMGVANEQRFADNDGVIQDDYRIQFTTEHLYWLHKAISEGANCFGYHVWTPIDCWSWRNSYKNRYGLIALDIHTQVKTLKKSAHWFKSLSTAGVLEVSQQIINKYADDY